MNRLRSLLSERWSRIFLAGALVSLVSALAVGVSDNPLGVVLAYLAAACAVAAFTTRWRTPRPFLVLAAWSVPGAVAAAVAHNVFDAVAAVLAGRPVLAGLFVALSVVSFLLAVLVFPAAVGVGLSGALGVGFLRRPGAHA